MPREPRITHIKDLRGVALDSITDGQFLVWNTGNKRVQPKTPTIADVSGLTADATQVNTLVAFPGNSAVGLIRIANNVLDTETVTIGLDVYEFDSAVDPGAVTEGNIRVHAANNGLTPADVAPALVAAINAEAAGAPVGSDAVKAELISNNEILLYSASCQNNTKAISTTMAGVNNAVDTAAMRGGLASGVKRFVALSRVPNATEVALDHMHFVLPFTPRVWWVEVKVTATGIPKAWVGGSTLGTTPDRIQVTNEGAVDWAATDTVTVFAME